MESKNQIITIRLHSLSTVNPEIAGNLGAWLPHGRTIVPSSMPISFKKQLQSQAASGSANYNRPPQGFVICSRFVVSANFGERLLSCIRLLLRRKERYEHYVVLQEYGKRFNLNEIYTQRTFVSHSRMLQCVIESVSVIVNFLLK